MSDLSNTVCRLAPRLRNSLDQIPPRSACHAQITRRRALRKLREVRDVIGELHALFLPRKINILLTDSLRIEIGFAGMGPTIGLVGTLNNEHAKTLVSKLRIGIKDPRGGPEQISSPAINRQRAFNRAFAGGEEDRGTLWLTFLIEADTAVPFDIVFRNEQAAVKLSEVGTELARAWTAFLAKATALNLSAWMDPNADLRLAKLKAFAKTQYDASANEPFRINARQATMDQFIWEPRLYECHIELEAYKSRHIYATDFSFSISVEDQARLQSNVDQMIAVACKQADPAASLNFAYPELNIK